MKQIIRRGFLNTTSKPLAHQYMPLLLRKQLGLVSQLSLHPSTCQCTAVGCVREEVDAECTESLATNNSIQKGYLTNTGVIRVPLGMLRPRHGDTIDLENWYNCMGQIKKLKTKELILSQVQTPGPSL